MYTWAVVLATVGRLTQVPSKIAYRVPVRVSIPGPRAGGAYGTVSSPPQTRR